MQHYIVALMGTDYHWSLITTVFLAQCCPHLTKAFRMPRDLVLTTHLKISAAIGRCVLSLKDMHWTWDEMNHVTQQCYKYSPLKSSRLPFFLLVTLNEKPEFRLDCRQRHSDTQQHCPAAPRCACRASPRCIPCWSCRGWAYRSGTSGLTSGSFCSLYLLEGGEKQSEVITHEQTGCWIRWQPGTLIFCHQRYQYLVYLDWTFGKICTLSVFDGINWGLITSQSVSTGNATEKAAANDWSM